MLGYKVEWSGKMRCFCWLFDGNLVGNSAPPKKCRWWGGLQKNLWGDTRQASRCTNSRIHSMPKSMAAKCAASLSLSRSNSSLKSSGSSPSRFSSSRATWRLDQALRYEALCHALGLHDFDAQPSCRRHWLHIATSTPCTSGDLTSHEHLQRLFCNRESQLFTANHKR